MMIFTFSKLSDFSVDILYQVVAILIAFLFGWVVFIFFNYKRTLYIVKPFKALIDTSVH